MKNGKGKVGLITGGTRGLGKAISIELSRAGYTVYITHRWGSVDQDELTEAFQQQSLPPPHIVECDVADPEATENLMQRIQRETGILDVFISNVAFSKTVSHLDEMKRRSLEHSLRYSSWPVIDYAQSARRILGQYPRYIIGISSDGPDVCHAGYDLAGASKAVLETLCRYLALRLKPHGTRVNCIRPGFLDTASARATFGQETLTHIQQRIGSIFLDPHAVAKTCVALCSGLMDAVTGQTIIVDEGWSLVSPLSLMTERFVSEPYVESSANESDFPPI